MEANQPGGAVVHSLETIEIRHLARGDIATVQAVFDAMSEEQRLQRFHAAMPRLSPTMLRLLADVDGVRHVALVLKVAGRPAGIARYVRTEPSSAEFAIALGDAYTRRGLGTLLFDALVAHARAHGVYELTFEFLYGNTAVRHLVLRHGATFHVSGHKQVGSLPTVASNTQARPLAG